MKKFIIYFVFAIITIAFCIGLSFFLFLGMGNSPIKTKIKDQTATHVNETTGVSFTYPVSYEDITYAWATDCVTQKRCRQFKGNPGFEYLYDEKTSENTELHGIDETKILSTGSYYLDDGRIGLTDAYQEAVLLSRYYFKNEKLYKTYTEIDKSIGGIRVEQIKTSPDRDKLNTTEEIVPHFTNNFGYKFYRIQVRGYSSEQKRINFCTFKQQEKLLTFCFNTYLAPEDQNIDFLEYEKLLSRSEIIDEIMKDFRFTK